MAVIIEKTTPSSNMIFPQQGTKLSSDHVESHLVSFMEDLKTDQNAKSIIEHKPNWNMATPYIERSCEVNIKKQILSGEVGCYLSGFSGNGKTTLVKKIVHDLRDQFQDIFYIQIQNSIPDSFEDPDSLDSLLEEFILYIIRKIEQDTEYEFAKRKPILAFQEYIENTKACIILDDFEGKGCSVFLDHIIQKKIKTSFVFVSSSKLITHLNPNSSAEVRERIHEFEIGEYSVEEAYKYIDKKLSKNDNFTKSLIDHVKDKIIQKRILNPYGLLLILTYINKCISEERINDVDNLDEMTVFFDDYESDSMIEKSIHKIWSGLSGDAKTLLLFISFYETSININTLIDNSSRSKAGYEDYSKCLKSFSELLSYNIISRSDGKLYSMNSLVKCALDYWLKQPDDENDYGINYKKARLMWVDICCALVHYVGNCYGNISQLKILDNAGGFEFIKNVVRWCIEPDDCISDKDTKDELLNKVIGIGNDASYYFYVRGDSANLKNSIEMFRLKAAKILHNQYQMFDALVTQLNVSSKRNQINDSKTIYSEIKKTGYEPDEYSDFKEYVKMNHAFALYHYSLKEYKEALSIWQELYSKKDKLEPKDVCTVSRWMSDCMLRITEPKFSYDEIMEVLQYSFSFSSKKNFKRDILQSYFKIVSLMLDYQKPVNEDEFFGKLNATKEVGDESYIAFYYFLAYRILKLESVNDPNRLEKARASIIEAEKHYRKIFDDAMCERIARIISNPNLDDENEIENQNDLGILLAQLY